MYIMEKRELLFVIVHVQRVRKIYICIYEVGRKDKEIPKHKLRNRLPSYNAI